jgi:hypothetical protein
MRGENLLNMILIIILLIFFAPSSTADSQLEQRKIRAIERIATALESIDRKLK